MHHLTGQMAAVKWNADRELYRGIAAVDHKDLQAVLRGYLQDSQQTLGRAWLHASVRDGVVAFAGGLLIERLPVTAGLDQADFDALMDTLEDGDPVARVALAQAGVVPGLELAEIASRDIRFECRCGLERVEASVCTLGAVDLRVLADEQGQAEVICDFCSERYVVSRDRLLELAEGLEGAGPQA